MRSLCMFSLTLVLVLVQLSVGGNNVNRLQPKSGYEKKEKDFGDRKDFARYEDWGLDWSDEEMMQHPIDEAPRRTDRNLGDICSYSNDCTSGCCLMDRATKVRSCQPRSLRGEKCSLGQVKGDLYVDACPCQSGMDFCAYPSQTCTK